MKECLPVRGDM